MSELKPVEGIDIVGPLPDELQKITVFSAGIASVSKEPDAGKALIKFLASPAARAEIVKSGMDPIAGGDELVDANDIAARIVIARLDRAIQYAAARQL